MIKLLLTILLALSVNSARKRHVPNSVVPSNDIFQSYNLKNWVEYLNLQQCVIVEIGDSYCALFVEFRPHNDSTLVQEYFLGICDRDTIVNWQLCPAEVERRRPNDCLFNANANVAARVHRRLCDLTTLLHYGNHCNCSNTLSETPLFDVEGFPTCFQPPLPESICTAGNVCGLAQCRAKQIFGRIYTVLCDNRCLGHQPFCETMDYETTIPSEVISFWSDWSDPICIDATCDILLSEAVCINKYTGLGDIDCLGPGTTCCPPEELYCRCRIISESSTLRIIKTYQSKQSYWRRTSLVLPQNDGMYLDYMDLNTEIPRMLKSSLKFKRSAKTRENDEYIEDDDEEDDTAEEDIQIEEDVNDEEKVGAITVTTLDSLEKEEIKQKVNQSLRNGSEFDEYDESYCDRLNIHEFLLGLCILLGNI